MDFASPTPPEWTKTASHAVQFCCPNCRASAAEAKQVWINRRAPVMSEDYRRKWQEFYDCQCGKAWWAWSSDRPPSEFANRESPPFFE
ncbi:hypothetical protein [Oscillatoria salina]|uniref:hypothetical protein n=1 Tax=Oscillatoria salina TaxID=331517 RepID=UPI0013BDA713|nr:hypothetical protein [Oscillatoria salina]MBZ8179182.1 hypothetical protein [Oscillatoria salina IIICB1]NET88033.1 hypothetical protein [Kamptonema sp. SIO1D9]